MLQGIKGNVLGFHAQTSYVGFFFFSLFMKSSLAQLSGVGSCPAVPFDPCGGVLFAMCGSFAGQEVAEFPLLRHSHPLLKAIMCGCSLNHIAHHLSFLLWVSGASSRMTSVIKRRFCVKDKYKRS